MAPATAAQPDRGPQLADRRWALHPSPEHLLLAILGDIGVVAALRGCGVCEGALSDAVRASIAGRADRSARFVAAVSSWRRGRYAGSRRGGIESVLARSLVLAEGAGRSLVTSAQLLPVMIDEPDCAAGDLLRAQGVTRYDLLNYLSHRLVRGVGAVLPPKPASPWVVCRVVLRNDHYTPMAFVVDVVRRVFDKGLDDAVRLTLDVHRLGSAECGVFAYDSAVAKIAAVTDLGRRHGHALHCVLVIKTTEREGANAELLT